MDPFIATGGVGAQIANVNPGASLPFGMTLTGPDTANTYGAPGFYHCAGYHWEDIYIRGFSHTHALGMGVTDYGTISVLPRASWADDDVDIQQRQADFSHETESASPGRYQVTLLDDGTEVEIAATLRGAHHRYTFADTSAPVVVFDLGAALGETHVEQSNITMDLATGSIEGFQNLLGSYSSRYGGLLTWFSAHVDPAPIASGTWGDDEGATAGSSEASGLNVGGWVQFAEGTQTVHLRVAISTVDLQGARANLSAELPDTDFEARAQEAADLWREELSTVRVRGGTEEQQTIFHTALYRSLLMPSRADDADGRYRGFDQTIHETLTPYYTDFSLWDTFRTLHPFFILAKPDRQQDFVRSLVQMTVDGGDMPRWPLGHGYTGGMVGSPASQVLAETWLKGLQDWDAQVGFDALYAQSQGATPQGRAGIAGYLEHGYVTTESASAAASRTLEFAWNDHALGLWAQALGLSEEAATLATQAGNWANTYDREQGWFVARSVDGSFAEVVDPVNWSDPSYTEGNAWHYLWGAPQDVQGMIELLYDGDQDAFVEAYEAYWQAVYLEPDDVLPDDYYWHGNEPDLHYAALGSLLGRPDLSADPIRWILQHRYAADPVGLDGNDDAGTLSAWYLLHAMGLYPVAGTDLYALGSPIFERVEVDGQEGTLVIRAPGVSDQARYLAQVRLGEEAVSGSTVTHGALLKAGELVLAMSEVAVVFTGP